MDDRWKILLIIVAVMFWWKYGLFNRKPDLEKNKTENTKSFIVDGLPADILKILLRYLQNQNHYTIEHFDENNYKIILSTELGWNEDPTFYTIFIEEYSKNKSTISIDAENQTNQEFDVDAQDKCLIDIKAAIFIESNKNVKRKLRKIKKDEEEEKKELLKITSLDFTESKLCPNCKHKVPFHAKYCPKCGVRLKPKSVENAYFSWKGLGLFDLIPGIRDLPYQMRFMLMIISVISILYLINK